MANKFQKVIDHPFSDPGHVIDEIPLLITPTELAREHRDHFDLKCF
jgi:hypothetical protein